MSRLTPARATALREAARLIEDLARGDQTALIDTLSPHKPRVTFSGGAHRLAMMGSTGTSTVSVGEAALSWARAARRRLIKAGAV